MATALQTEFQQQLPSVAPGDPLYATQVVDAVLSAARKAGASDVHLVPAEGALRMSFRIDGVLQPIAMLPRQSSGNIVSRLKVLAELLTYQTDVPQEGRLRDRHGDIEMRVSTFPTLYGEKAVIRLFVDSRRFQLLEELGLPDDVAQKLKVLLDETGGTIMISGPAGSGKTTTAYACLRELTQRSSTPRSLVSLEDPIESVIDGVAQSQIRPASGFDYERGLKSLMRQDPEVILVGEIRDRTTAEIVFQAALTGHLVLTTFHAGSSAEAVGRLLDMGLEPYQLRSGLQCVINQRLVRKLCSCARESTDPGAKMGLDVDRLKVPVGCDQCAGTGYKERTVLAEILLPNSGGTANAILSRSDAREIEKLAVEAGLVSRWERAKKTVEAGVTSPAEIRRVLGFR